MAVTGRSVATTEQRGEGEVADDSELLAVLDVLGDAVSREILVAAATGAPTVEELADQCGVSGSTVYRRLDRLDALGLVERTNPVSASPGYRTTMRGLYVAVGDDGVTVSSVDGERESAELAAAFDVVRDAITVERLQYDRNAGTVEVCFTLENGDFETLRRLCSR